MSFNPLIRELCEEYGLSGTGIWNIIKAYLQSGCSKGSLVSRRGGSSPDRRYKNVPGRPGQLPATEVASLHDSTRSLTASCAGTQLTQIQPGLSRSRRNRIEASQLEGGSLASCHARGRFSPYGLSTGS